MNISTLIADIYNTLEGSKEPSKFTSVSVNEHFTRALKPREYKREPNTLRFSEVGTPCKRALWYKVHRPQLAEKHNGATLIKFLYGNMIEEMVLSLVEASGHEVTGKQEKAEITLSKGWKVRGSGDARIDGVPVDVKSVTKASETKFKEGLKDDPFGYRLQLSGYATAWGDKEAGFLTAQKELGHFGYYPIEVDKGWTMEKLEEAAEAARSPLESLPRLDPVPEGKSGNTRLCTTCSYCGFKESCYPEAQKFMYAKGPVYLVEVKKMPKVDLFDKTEEVL